MTNLSDSDEAWAAEVFGATTTDFEVVEPSDRELDALAADFGALTRLEAGLCL